jgi:hypothetical protein
MKVTCSSISVGVGSASGIDCVRAGWVEELQAEGTTRKHVNKRWKYSFISTNQGIRKGYLSYPLGCEIEQIVRIHIQYEPYRNYHSKGDKACAVIDYRKEGEQKNPENSIVELPD